MARRQLDENRAPLFAVEAIEYRGHAPPLGVDPLVELPLGRLLAVAAEDLHLQQLQAPRRKLPYDGFVGPRDRFFFVLLGAVRGHGIAGCRLILNQWFW